MTTPDPTQPPPPAASSGAAPEPPPQPLRRRPRRPPHEESRHDRRERRREERRARHEDGRYGPSSAGLVIGIILVVGGAIVLLGRATDLTLGPTRLATVADRARRGDGRGLVRDPAARRTRPRDPGRDPHDDRRRAVVPGDVRAVRDVGLRVGPRGADRRRPRHAALRPRAPRRRAGPRRAADDARRHRAVPRPSGSSSKACSACPASSSRTCARRRPTCRSCSA